MVVTNIAIAVEAVKIETRLFEVKLGEMVERLTASQALQLRDELTSALELHNRAQLRGGIGIEEPWPE
jgi:hypothetical protein